MQGQKSVKRKWWYALLFMKCPRCHHGNLFNDPNPYHLKHITDMPRHCAVCNQVYFPEVGFYFGAMYMSYGLTVFFSGVNVALLWLVFGFSMYGLVIGNAVLLLAGLPLYYRYSRAVWLMFFTSFSNEAFDAAELKSRS
jgi:hypothetical protein